MAAVVSRPSERGGLVNRPVWARLFARQAEGAEAKGFREQREALLARVEGRVLEIGAGTGLNFPHYSDVVSEVVAIEPEPYLAGLAEDRAHDCPVPTTVVRASAESLPVGDGEFDAVVSFHVLCSVDEPRLVLNEVRRVLKPGGELRFNEHVASGKPRRAQLQRAADLVWPRLAGGCHLGRDTESVIRESGFEIEEINRYSFGIPPLDPPKAHILGRAVSLAAAAPAPELEIRP